MVRFVNERKIHNIHPCPEEDFYDNLYTYTNYCDLESKDKKNSLIDNGWANTSEIVHVQYVTTTNIDNELVFSAMLIIEEVTYYTQKRFDEIFDK